MLSLWLTVLTVFACLSTVTLSLANPATLDTCVFFKGDLARELDDLLDIVIPDIFGHLNQCLCISVLDAFIDTNIITQLAVPLVGASALNSVLVTLITSTSGVQTCQYPENSIPTCSRAHVCGFVCEEGFRKCPNGTCQQLCPTTPAKRHQIPFPAPRCPWGQELSGASGARSFEFI